VPLFARCTSPPICGIHVVCDANGCLILFLCRTLALDMFDVVEKGWKVEVGKTPPMYEYMLAIEAAFLKHIPVPTDATGAVTFWENRVNCSLMVGSMLCKLERMKDVESHLQCALKEAEAHPEIDPKLRFAIYPQLMYFLRRQGRYKEADKLDKRVVDIGRDQHAKDGVKRKSYAVYEDLCKLWARSFFVK
jgi:hypothetical protein